MEKIPHVLHYCWFGRKPKPKLVTQCMLSWKKYLPGWEIKEWNEDNYDVNHSEYAAQAYRSKAYAFVADVARFDILHRYGGVYVDTDVELIRPIPEEILEHPAFGGMQSDGWVAPGLIFGAVPSHPFVQEMLSYYETHPFQGTHDLKETVVTYTTDALRKYGYQINGAYQELHGVAVYPSCVFCGYDIGLHEAVITPNTISVHHYAASWVSGRRKIKLCLLRLLKESIGIERYRSWKMLKRRLINREH